MEFLRMRQTWTIFARARVHAETIQANLGLLSHASSLCDWQRAKLSATEQRVPTLALVTDEFRATALVRRIVV